MRDGQHAPNVLSYTCALEACLREEVWLEAAQLLADMHGKGAIGFFRQGLSVGVHADALLLKKLKRTGYEVWTSIASCHIAGRNASEDLFTMARAGAARKTARRGAPGARASSSDLIFVSNSHGRAS